MSCFFVRQVVGWTVGLNRFGCDIGLFYYLPSLLFKIGPDIAFVLAFVLYLLLLGNVISRGSFTLLFMTTCCLREYFESNTAKYSNNFVSSLSLVDLEMDFLFVFFLHNSDINEAN